MPRQTFRVADGIAMPSSLSAAPISASSMLHRHLGHTPFDSVLVCGSGLSVVVEHLDVEASVSMRDVGLPVSSVPGHAGMLHAARTPNGSRVLVAAGRVHLYEGFTAQDVTVLVRTAALCGALTLVVTNAAGSLHADWAPGTPVLLTDQINLTGTNPLSGAESEPFGRSRFVDMSNVYDPELRALARGVDPDVKEGVYAALAGPSYETPAEIRMLAALGADLVGMSTVCETIAARHLDMRILGLSLVTNLAAGLGGKLDHSEVTAAGHAAADRVAFLLAGILDAL